MHLPPFVSCDFRSQRSPEVSDHAVAHGNAVIVGVLEVSAKEGDIEGPQIGDDDAAVKHGEVLEVAEDPPESKRVEGVQEAGENEFNLCHN